MPTTDKRQHYNLVLYRASEAQVAAASRRGTKHGFGVAQALTRAALLEKLDGPRHGVLAMFGFDSKAKSIARALRKTGGWGTLPIFAIVPDEQIDRRMMDSANIMRVEILPTSVPEARRFLNFKDAHRLASLGKRRPVHNRRAHFRLPLRVKATLCVDIEIADISMGGVAFFTCEPLPVGARLFLDIRALLGDAPEDERGLPLEVVSLKAHKPGSYFIGARFMGMPEHTRKRLNEALELIEPTEE